MSNGKQKRAVTEAPASKKARCPSKYTEPGRYEVRRYTETLTEACIDKNGNPYNDTVDVLVVEYADRLPDVEVHALHSAPSAAGQQVRIRLVGVPVDDLLDGTVKRWWPLPAAPSVSARVISGANQLGAR